MRNSRKMNHTKICTTFAKLLFLLDTVIFIQLRYSTTPGIQSKLSASKGYNRISSTDPCQVSTGLNLLVSLKKNSTIRGIYVFLRIQYLWNLCVKSREENRSSSTHFAWDRPARPVYWPVKFSAISEGPESRWARAPRLRPPAASRRQPLFPQLCHSCAPRATVFEQSWSLRTPTTGRTL